MDDSKINPKLEPCFEVPDWEHSPKKKHKKNPVDKSAILEETNEIIETKPTKKENKTFNESNNSFEDSAIGMLADNSDPVIFVQSTPVDKSLKKKGKKSLKGDTRENVAKIEISSNYVSTEEIKKNNLDETYTIAKDNESKKNTVITDAIKTSSSISKTAKKRVSEKIMNDSRDKKKIQKIKDFKDDSQFIPTEKVAPIKESANEGYILAMKSNNNDKAKFVEKSSSKKDASVVNKSSNEIVAKVSDESMAAVENQSVEKSSSTKEASVVNTSSNEIVTKASDESMATVENQSCEKSSNIKVADKELFTNSNGNIFIKDIFLTNDLAKEANSDIKASCINQAFEKEATNPTDKVTETSSKEANNCTKASIENYDTEHSSKKKVITKDASTLTDKVIDSSNNSTVEANEGLKAAVKIDFSENSSNAKVISNENLTDNDILISNDSNKEYISINNEKSSNEKIITKEASTLTVTSEPFTEINKNASTSTETSEGNNDIIGELKLFCLCAARSHPSHPNIQLHNCCCLGVKASDDLWLKMMVYIQIIMLMLLIWSPAQLFLS